MSATAESHTHRNADPDEVAKFSALASEWWDTNGNFRPLHDINPLRLVLIDDVVGGVRGKRMIDVGCGGGLVSEGLARMGAHVTGIDLSTKALAVAKLHALEAGIAVEYRECTAETMADEHPASFDAVTCLEMLEHVPEPASVIAACARLAKPGAPVICSTLSRTAKAYVMAVLGAEYVLRLLPQGTHEFSRFIKPAELANHARMAGLQLVELRGMDYNPLTRAARWTADASVNYVAIFRNG